MTSLVTGRTWHVNGSQQENVLTDLRRKQHWLLCLLSIFSLWHGRKLLSLKYVHICYSVFYGWSPVSFLCLVGVCAKCWQKHCWAGRMGRDNWWPWPLKWDQPASTVKKVNIRPRQALHTRSLSEVLSGYIILTLRKSEGMGGLMEILSLSNHTGG